MSAWHGLTQPHLRNFVRCVLSLYIYLIRSELAHFFLWSGGHMNYKNRMNRSGMKKMKLWKFEKAEMIWDEILAMDATHLDGLFFLGSIYLGRANNDLRDRIKESFCPFFFY